MKNGKFPDLVQNLINLGFELYSKKDGDDKPATIPESAFEQLFDKLNFGQTYARMAYRFLSEVRLNSFFFFKFCLIFSSFRMVVNH